jgi:hypothetical protein
MTKQVDALVAHLKSLSDEELRDLATTPEWAYFMHKVYRIRPGEPLTLERIEMEARICREYPCAIEFYEAQVELARHRARFHSQREIGSSPTGR